MTKIKVLVTLGSLGVGGNEMFAMNLFHYIDKSRFQMDFVVYDRTRLDYYNEVIQSGGKVFFCESKKSSKIGQLIDQKVKVVEVLKKERYDIIHCNSCSFLGMLPGVVAGRKAGIKVIAHSHGVGLQNYGLFDSVVRHILKKYLCSSIDFGFSCSDTAASTKYTEAFLKSGRHFIIRNAIDTKKYVFNTKNREEVRKEFKISDDDFLLAHVGRFEEEKNHGFILNVFSELLRIQPHSKLLLIGSGTLFQKYKMESRRLHISDKVIFTGQRDNVFKLYSAMDCFIMPSVYEGFPFVLVEAQINGLKCIVSDTISNNVNISNEIFFLPLTNNYEEWARTIVLRGNKRIDKELMTGIIEEYDLANETKRIEILYKRLIEFVDKIR